MLLEVRNVKKSFKRGRVHALNSVSLELKKNETLGIVGASGSGKSTLAKIVLGVLKPDEGEVLFQGEAIGAIFQDPFLSLDPQMTVAEILEEPFRIRRQNSRGFLQQKVEELLSLVDLPGSFAKRFPHQLSGGECQRVAIARAISTEPPLIVCDEPVSSLDTLIQAQILNLLLRLQKQKQISYFFISHDERVVRHMSDRVLVMDDGKVLK